MPEVDVDVAYVKGAASVTVPGGDTYCDVESTDWDEGLGAGEHGRILRQ
jgi:chitodextrinase